MSDDESVAWLHDEGEGRHDSTNEDANLSKQLSNLEKLKSLREKIHWEIDEDRYEFIRQVIPLISDWVDRLPDLRDIFRPEEIDRLLLDSLSYKERDQDSHQIIHLIEVGEFIKFVVRTGYKDGINEDSTPSRHRNTPIHHAARHWAPYCNTKIRDLFKVYDRFDVNYTDECGHTHFHIACQFGCDDVVQKFLELGQVDPNLLAPKSIDPPLHLALAGGHKQVVALLLRHGANPNLVNAAGSTPLHVICLRSDDLDLAKMLFELSDEKYLPVRVDVQDELGNSPLHLALKSGRMYLIISLLRNDVNPNLANNDGFTPLHIICKYWFDGFRLAKIFFDICAQKKRLVQVDAVDRLGRTPLQWAVASLASNTVELLLDHGADLTCFVFPTKSFFTQRLHKPQLIEITLVFELRLASGAIAVIESLEKRGYELNRSNALTIMTLFVKYGCLRHPIERYDDKKLKMEAKDKIIGLGQSLYDLIQLQPEKAVKQLTSMFACENYLTIYYLPPLEPYQICFAHLYDKLIRQFLRRWQQEFFLVLTPFRLPDLCCDMILKKLKNKDLYNMFLAASGVI